MKRYVIIGNCIAAAGCVEGIRSVDPDGAVTVVSEEKHPAYCRPLISYFLEGRASLDRISYRAPDFYDRAGCTVLYGRRAVTIRPEEKTVELDDGTSLPYDALCVSTGSSPFVPAMEGLENVRSKYSFMTLDDAIALDKAVTPESRVFVVGAGMIGLKCAEGLLGRAASVTVCDLADRVLSSVLDFECAALVQRRLEEHGMRFYLGDSVLRFEPDTAYLKSGAVVGFDVLVLAVGIRPNVSLVKDAGGEVGRGIVVDETMRTSLPGVFAAGDCAQSFDVSSGESRVLAILPNAYMQGHAAGVNMAGGREVFDKGIVMNSIGFFGMHAMTAGSYEGEVYEEKTGSSVKRLYTKDGLLKGFMLVGCDERAGIYTSMIRERTPLDSVDFGLMKRGATTAGYCKEKRGKMFGGVV